MTPQDPEYSSFKRNFWEWFDKLPKEKKEQFWGYKDDMAETNFYFTVWSKETREK